MPVQRQAPSGQATTVRVVKKTFFEVEAKTEEGDALADREFTVELPDGEMIEGKKLDADGKHRHEETLAGTALFCFGDRQPTPVNPEVTTFFHLQAVDEDGNILEGWKYSIELPDGTKQEGEIDESGLVRLDEVPEGSFKVTMSQPDGCTH